MADEHSGSEAKGAGQKTRGEREGWKAPEVLEGVRRREPEALGRFYDGAFPNVYRLAYRMMGNREAAEDVTQEVFLKVYRAADRLQVDRDPMPWLSTITYNACRDAGRRSSARPEVRVDAMVIGDVAAATEGPEEALMKREREQILEDALLALDEQSRAVVILHDYCGLSHDEIARVTDTSHDGVRKRYSRTLKKLAEIIGSRPQ